MLLITAPVTLPTLAFPHEKEGKHKERLGWGPTLSDGIQGVQVGSRSRPCLLNTRTRGYQYIALGQGLGKSPLFFGFSFR